MSMVMNEKELNEKNWVLLAGFVEDQNKLLEAFKGKTITDIQYKYAESEALIICFSDNTSIMLESYANNEEGDWVDSTLEIYLPKSDEMTEYGFLKKED